MDAKEKEANSSVEAVAKEDEDLPRESRRRKYVWIVILLSVIGGFIGHISIQLQNYLRFRMLQTDEPSKIGFTLPDLIICTPNYFWDERIVKYKWHDKLNYRDQILGENLRKVYFAIVEETLNVSHMSDAVHAQNLNLAKLSFLPTLAVGEVGVSIPDIMTFCEFGGKSCDIRNFTTFLHHEYGVCVRFHQRLDSIRSYGLGSRNGLIANFRISEKSKAFDFGRNYFYLKAGYRFFIQRKETFQNVEKVIHAGQVFMKSMIGVSHIHFERMDTMTSPCRSESRRRLCFLERGIGLTCKEFLVDEYALMQIFAQNSLVEKCQCVSYEWAITEEQRKYPSCHSLPADVYLNAGISEVDGNFTVELMNTTKVPLEGVLNVAVVRERIKCYLEAKETVDKLRLEESYQASKEKLWTPLCVQDIYKHTILTQFNPMRSGQLYRSNKEVFLMNWEVQMKALNESGINQTCVFVERVAQLLKESYCITNPNADMCLKMKEKITPARSTPDMELRKYNLFMHQILFFANYLTATVRRQMYEYPSAQFFADVGGLSGVWIGICVLSIFDLVESTIKSLRDQFKKK